MPKAQLPCECRRVTVRSCFRKLFGDPCLTLAPNVCCAPKATCSCGCNQAPAAPVTVAPASETTVVINMNQACAPEVAPEPEAKVEPKKVEKEADIIPDAPAAKEEAAPKAEAVKEAAPAEEAKPAEEVKPAEEAKPAEAPAEEAKPVEKATTVENEPAEKAAPIEDEDVAPFIVEDTPIIEEIPEAAEKAAAEADSTKDLVDEFTKALDNDIAPEIPAEEPAEASAAQVILPIETSEAAPASEELDIRDLPILESEPQQDQPALPDQSKASGVQLYPASHSNSILNQD